MAIEKHGNKWRVKKMVNGKTYTLTFDHKPSQLEIIDALSASVKKPMTTNYGSQTLLSGIEIFLDSKSNVLSPSTKRGYKSVIRNIPQKYLDMRMADIDNITVQRLVNEYSETRSPKTVKNMYGLIVSVFKLLEPDFKFDVKLPQEVKKDVYVPTDEEVKRIIDDIRGSKYYVATCLGALGLRKSEIIAITGDDVYEKDGKWLLSINKAIVRDENYQYVQKTTKTTDSARVIYIPTDIALLIKGQGFAYKGFPDSIGRNLTRVQDRLGIQNFPMHRLRHFFCSYSHNVLHLSPEQIKAAGGWKNTSTVMEKVYQHGMREEESKIKISDSIGKLF